MGGVRGPSGRASVNGRGASRRGSVATRRVGRQRAMWPRLASTRFRVAVADRCVAMTTLPPPVIQPPPPPPPPRPLPHSSSRLLPSPMPLSRPQEEEEEDYDRNASSPQTYAPSSQGYERQFRTRRNFKILLFNSNLERERKSIFRLGNLIYGRRGCEILYTSLEPRKWP